MRNSSGRFKGISRTLNSTVRSFVLILLLQGLFGELGLAQDPPAPATPASANNPAESIPPAAIIDPSNSPPGAPGTTTITPAPADPLAGMDQMLQPAVGLMNNLNALRTNAAIEKILKIAMDPEIRAAVEQMRAKPDMKNLFIYQIVFLIAMFLVKNAEYSRLEKGKFLKRVWIGIWTGLVTMLGLSFAIPYIFYGKPYWDLLQGIYRILN